MTYDDELIPAVGADHGTASRSAAAAL